MGGRGEAKNNMLVGHRLVRIKTKELLLRVATEWGKELNHEYFQNIKLP